MVGLNFFEAKRRREIEAHARHIGVMDTDYPDRHLIAWVWHNPNAIDQIGSLMEATYRMGRRISEEEAKRIIEQAASIPMRRTADSLAKFLKLTLQQRTYLKITTIGACDFSRAQRKKHRKHKARMRKERARRAAGMKPQSESLSSTQPWKKEGKSRAAWYKARKARETTLSAPLFLISQDKTVSAGLSVLTHGACYASAIVKITEIQTSSVSSSSRKANLIRADIAVPRPKRDRFRDQYLKQQASQRASAEAALERYRLAAGRAQ